MAADPLTKSTVDDLFNYDIDSDDPFGERNTTAKPRDDKPTLSPRAAKRRAGADDGDVFGLDLGLDQEVKIKKRKPNPKLDEALLLSKPGIPKLRALAKDGISKKLRLKGKGHEFSDAAKLLNYFQLWLDDLYPRAKFADGLQIVEKVGHSKRMQVMRREWINESKHKELYGNDDDMYGGGQSNGNAEDGAAQNGPTTANGEGLPNAAPDDEPNSDDLFFPDSNRKPEARGQDEPEEDELDALLAEQESIMQPQPQPLQKPLAEDSEGEDDLEALLTEAERPNISTIPRRGAMQEIPEEGDDLNALMADRETESNSAVHRKQPAHDEDDDELDALMAE
jgi:replication fork protection complex subunit Csm3/Swi3